jgi:triacylglycerol lipase
VTFTRFPYVIAARTELRNSNFVSVHNNAQHQMIRIYRRAIIRSPTLLARAPTPARLPFSSTPWRKEDPRLEDFGRKITDEFAVMREKYGRLCTSTSYAKHTNVNSNASTTIVYRTRPRWIGQKHTVVLAHGLLGFDEVRLAGNLIPGLHYWRGITEALSHNGIEVIVAAVPPSGSIEARAAKLAESIAQKAKGKQVNIIACVHVTPDPSE